METQNALNIFERFNNWIKESVTIKLMSIGFLVLILLIPSTWITGLMEERQQRAGQVMEEVAENWSGPQTLAGPILVIPFRKEEKIDKGKDGIEIREVILEQNSAIFGLSSSRPILNGGRSAGENDHGAMPNGAGCCCPSLGRVISAGPGSLTICMTERGKAELPTLESASRRPKMESADSR